MRITPMEIQQKSFQRGLRGYSVQEGENFLELVSGVYAEAVAEINRPRGGGAPRGRAGAAGPPRPPLQAPRRRPRGPRLDGRGRGKAHVHEFGTLHQEVTR